MPLAEIPSVVQEEASRPQLTPTGSNTSPQEAMQCDSRLELGPSWVLVLRNALQITAGERPLAV